MHDAGVLRATVQNYSGRASSFSKWAEEPENTQSAECARNTFTEQVKTAHPTIRPLRIIDAGCGSGRDLQAFAMDRDFAPEGLEPCEAFSQEARTRSSCQVHTTDCATFFTQEAARVDVNESAPLHGVFALCSLFHIPRQELPPILASIYSSLVRGGIFFCSWPSRGDTDAQGHDGRWHNTMPLDMQLRFLNEAGFAIEYSHASKIRMYNGIWSFIIASKRA